MLTPAEWALRRNLAGDAKTETVQLALEWALPWLLAGGARGR